VRFSRFFIDRPVFAVVLSVVVLAAGLIAIRSLPISEYPEVTPPTITVRAIYPGANPAVLGQTVGTPLEEAINGVDGLRYITSTTTSDGTSSVVCTFQLDRNIDLAANDVQNQVNNTIGRLPAEVRATGVTVTKNSGTFVIAMGLTSTDPQYDRVFISNYAANNIVDVIKRIRGVNDVRIFGERRYAMRLWLDPTRLNLNHLTASDIVSALQTPKGDARRDPDVRIAIVQQWRQHAQQGGLIEPAQRLDGGHAHLPPGIVEHRHQPGHASSIADGAQRPASGRALVSGSFGLQPKQRRR